MNVTLYSLCLYGSIGISVCLLTSGISLPCAYLFDPEKSQIVFMMSFMASSGIIAGFVLLINLVFPVKENNGILPDGYLTLDHKYDVFVSFLLTQRK